MPLAAVAALWALVLLKIFEIGYRIWKDRQSNQEFLDQMSGLLPQIMGDYLREVGVLPPADPDLSVAADVVELPDRTEDE